MTRDDRRLDPLLAARAFFRASGIRAWLVGGRVRDGLLGRWTVDTDIVVRSGALQHAARIASEHRGAFVPLDPGRGIARVVWPSKERGAAPRGVLDLSDAVGGQLETDLLARDFTVNALALPLDAWPTTGEQLEAGLDLAVRGRPSWLPPAAVIDVVGGRADLFARRLRLVDPSALDADPLRMLRAPRLAAQLGFEIEPGTQAAIRERAGRIIEPAAERVREEIMQLLACDPPDAHVELLHGLGLLIPLLSELDPVHDGGQTLRRGLLQLDAMARLQAILIDSSVPAPSEAIAMVAARHRGGLRRFLESAGQGGHDITTWLRLAALLAEAPGARPEVIAGRLRLGNAELAALEGWLGLAPRVLEMAAGSAGHGPRQQHRFFAAAGRQGVGAVLVALVVGAVRDPSLAGAAALASTADRLLEAWFERYEEIVAPQPLVDGTMLMARLGLEPGPHVGRILVALLEAQAAGEIVDEAGALQMARLMLQST